MAKNMNKLLDEKVSLKYRSLKYSLFYFIITVCFECIDNIFITLLHISDFIMR